MCSSLNDRLANLSNISVLTVTTVLFLVFVVSEIAGAVLGNSLSLLSDAGAMLSDVISYCMSLYCERYKIKYGLSNDIEFRQRWKIP